MKTSKFFRIVLVSIFLSCFLFGYSYASVSPYFSINKGKSITNLRLVTLYLRGPENTKDMKISNNENFSGAKWEKYKTSVQHYLTYGAGDKTVYMMFRNKNGDISKVYKDRIELAIPEEMVVDFKIDNNETSASSRYVTLTLDYSVGVEEVKVSNYKDFSSYESYKIRREIQWVLLSGSGKKNIYLSFKDGNGNKKTVSKTINYKESGRYIKEGGLIKGQNTDGIYFYGNDGKIHPFVNRAFYDSWYLDFDDVEHVSSAKLGQYHLGDPVCIRQGTWLVRFTSGPRVYAVEYGCQLRPILSEVEAYILYGPNWNKRILNLSDVFRSYYKVNYYDASDKDKDLEDKDKDGVDDQTEKRYETSDRKNDSDNDKLSDYEEIYYWFTDPNNADSDGDGFKDGGEILSGFSPLSAESIKYVPNDTYEYPKGTVVRRKISSGNRYYYFGKKYNYNLSNSLKTRLMTSNNFREQFVVDPILKIKFKTPEQTLKENSSASKPDVLNKNGDLIDL